MKLITRCPECSTSFRVHEAQLSMRQGKVRCGACGLVFDAYGSLVEVVRERRPGQEAPAEQSATRRTRTGGEASREARPMTRSTMPLASVSPSVADSRFMVEAVTIWPDDFQAGSTVPLAASNHPARQPRAEQPRPPTTTSAVAADVALSVAGPAPGSAWQPPAPDVKDPPAGFDFAIAGARKPVAARWKIGAFVLAILLGGQLLYAGRSIVAASFPGLRPLLTALCAPLHCEVPVPQHIEHLKLESSDLRAETDRMLGLTVVIRNQARYEQAYPALLLTLMDERNRPVARRLLQPREYLGIDPGNDQAIPAGGMVTARIAVESTSRADGYEVLLVYP